MRNSANKLLRNESHVGEGQIRHMFIFAPLWKCWKLVPFISVSPEQHLFTFSSPLHSFGLPWWLSGKESVWQSRIHRRCRFNPWAGKIPWRRKWQPIPIFFPGKSHVQRSPAVYRSMGSQGVRHNWAHIYSFTLLITNMEEQGLAIIFQERTRYGHPLWALHCQLWWLVYFPISMYSHVTVGLSHHNYISCLWKSSRKWKKNILFFK